MTLLFIFHFVTVTSFSSFCVQVLASRVDSSLKVWLSIHAAFAMPSSRALVFQKRKRTSVLDNLDFATGLHVPRAPPRLTKRYKVGLAIAAA